MFSRKYLSSVNIISPCMVKDVYLRREANKLDPNIGGLTKKYHDCGSHLFISLTNYNKELITSLETFMANLGEHHYVEEENEWWISIYWRMQWLKHRYGIPEMDFYWEIYHLYRRAPIITGGKLMDMLEVGIHMMVMLCKASTLVAQIESLTGGHQVAIFVDGQIEGLKQINISFGNDRNFVEKNQKFKKSTCIPSFKLIRLLK